MTDRGRIELRLRDPEFTLDVGFMLRSGITILFGPSGAGKSTLLDCIAGLRLLDEGRIEVSGVVFFEHASAINRSVQWRRVGYVFQELALFPHLSVEQNITYGIASLPKNVRRERVDRIVEAMRISHLRRRRPAEISGGEARRVALARSLVTDPRILLLDEPLAGLDIPTRSKIVDDLRAWNELHRIPILYVTHQRDEVFALGERVLLMEQGRIVADGAPHEVMAAAQNLTAAQLGGFENVFEAVVQSMNPARGTMTCGLSGIEIETPLFHVEGGQRVQIGIRAGDVLVAAVEPVGLSARNILRGRIVNLAERDMIVAARVACGVEVEVHLTLAARDALDLTPGREVWLVVKTHSIHVAAKDRRG